MTEGSGAAVGLRRRRWRRRVLAVVVVVGLPVLVFGLSNLWLATPPGRSYVAGRISRATGLPARVGPGWWLPWSGLELRRIEIGRPPQLASAGAALVVRVGRVKVEPHWRELARGRLVPGMIVLEDPEVDLPVELLAHLAAEGGAPQERAVVVAEPEPGVHPAAPVAGDAGGTPELAGPAAEPVEVVPMAEPALPATSWLIVHSGSFKVGPAAGGGCLVSIAGIDARVPLRGAAADGSLVVAELNVAGRSLGPQQVPLRWESPRLSVTGWQPVAGPFQLGVRAQCIPSGSLPFVFECILPEQAVDPDQADAPAGIAVGRIRGAVAMGGHLRMLSSLAGQGRIEAEGVTAESMLDRSGPLKFDQCRAWGKLAGGVLQVVDARAAGDSLSLLGNAVLVADGRVGAVLRVVVPQEAVAPVTARLGGLLPQPPAGFRPLETPDRWIVDCTLGGTIGEEWVRVGDGPPRSLGEVREEWRRLAPGRAE